MDSNGLQRTQLFCLSLLTTKCQVKELQQVLRRQDSNATKVPLSTPPTQLTFSGCVHRRYLNSWSQKMGFIPRTSCTVLRPLPKWPRTTRDEFGPCFVAWWCILLAFVMWSVGFLIVSCGGENFKCNSNTYPGLNLQERPGNPTKMDQKLLGFFLLVSCVIAATNRPGQLSASWQNFGRGLWCQDSQESIVDQIPLFMFLLWSATLNIAINLTSFLHDVFLFKRNLCTVHSAHTLSAMCFAGSILRIRFNAVRWAGSNLERQQCTLYGR